MKKYDIAILFLYILIIVGATSLIYKERSTVARARAELYEITQNQDINKVVINVRNTPIEVFTMPEETPKKWNLSGVIDMPDDIGKIYIKDRTLFINGKFKIAGTRVLKLREDIPVEIIDSPKAKVLSYEELQKRLKKQ